MGLNVTKMANRLAAMAGRFEAEITAALDQVAASASASLRSTTRFNDRTGRLRASFATAGAGMDARRVSAGMPYAFFLEFGTRTITPRPFMGDARTVVADALPRAMADAMERAIRG